MTVLNVARTLGYSLSLPHCSRVAGRQEIYAKNGVDDSEYRCFHFRWNTAFTADLARDDRPMNVNRLCVSDFVAHKSYFVISVVPVLPAEICGLGGNRTHGAAKQCPSQRPVMERAGVEPAFLT